ncbi:MAG: PD-(D/E)XK nuclease family protein [Candidatus Nanopelagicales bacterium]
MSSIIYASGMITSYSSIQRFAVCPRQWYLAEVRRLGPVMDKRTGALGFGGRIHTALEAWASGQIQAPVAMWDTLMSREYVLASERGGFGLDELDKENALGWAMLDGFMDWWETEGEDEEFEVIGVETRHAEELLVDTPQGEEVAVWVYGKLDRRLRNRETGQLWVADWKTTAYLQEAAKQGVEQSPQPRIYAALLRQEDAPVVGIRYTFLRKVLRTAKARPPYYFNYDLQLPQYNVDHHLSRVRAFAGQMVDTAMRIGHGVDHEFAAPFNVGWHCKSCPFNTACYLMQTTGMEAAEDYLTDNFHEVDPLERYKAEAEQEVSQG